MTTRIRKICAAAILSAIVFTVQPQSVEGSILVGTWVASENTSINLANLNALINNYNTDFSASLAQIVSEIDKIEDDNGAAGFENGTLLLSDFAFYSQINSGMDLQFNIFDMLPETFAANANGWSFDGLDQNVMAFVYNGVTEIDYYVSKDGNKGWSLWLAMSGANPVYTDLGDASNTGNPVTSINGAGFTRGNITNTDLDYDPITNGISHISFFRAEVGNDDENGVVPEPFAATIWGCNAMIFALVGMRRRRQ